MKASCLCKAVSYRIAGDIRRARYCHCESCRKFSGTAFAAWGLVQTAQLIVEPAEPRVIRYDSGAGLRVSCATCGCPVWYEPAGMPQFRGIPLGAIDDGDVPAPEMHVWVQSRVPWVAEPTDLPLHFRHPHV